MKEHSEPSKEENQFHVFVTSNESKTHIIIGETDKTLCGIENEPIEKKGCRFPSSEIRYTYNLSDFKKWVDSQRHESGKLGFCRTCLKAFDKRYNTQQHERK